MVKKDRHRQWGQKREKERCDARVPGSVPRGTTWFLGSLGIYLSPPEDMLSLHFLSDALLSHVCEHTQKITLDSMVHYYSWRF